MRIELNTEHDLINYLNYLHQQGRLSDRFPTIHLDEFEGRQYLNWLDSRNDSDDESDSEEPSYCDEDHNVNKRWTQEERDVLASLIKQGFHPSDIGQALKRTTDGVRHQARSHYRMVYQSGKWRDYSYT